MLSSAKKFCTRNSQICPGEHCSYWSSRGICGIGLNLQESTFEAAFEAPLSHISAFFEVQWVQSQTTGLLSLNHSHWKVGKTERWKNHKMINMIIILTMFMVAFYILSTLFDADWSAAAWLNLNPHFLFFPKEKYTTFCINAKQLVIEWAVRSLMLLWQPLKR